MTRPQGGDRDHADQRTDQTAHGESPSHARPHSRRAAAAANAAADLGLIRELREGRLTELERIVADGQHRSVSELAAAIAEHTDLAEDQAIDRHGRGPFSGAVSPEPKTDVASIDCFSFVLEVLHSAFAAAGQGGAWQAVEQHMRALGGITHRGATGVDLISALQSALGWKAIYYAPDLYRRDQRLPPARPDEYRPTETPAKDMRDTFGTAHQRGTYYANPKLGYPGVKVDPDPEHMVLNYAPRGDGIPYDPALPLGKRGVDPLRRLTFGVIAVHGGYHMACIAGGTVYEVHWGQDSHSPFLFDAHPFDEWALDFDGVVAAPADELDRAFADEAARR
jgi:hypothetical protein